MTLPTTNFVQNLATTSTCMTKTHQSPKRLEHHYHHNQSPINLEHLIVNSRSPMKLSKKWMDYQGFKNWEGLLDPLDDDLRQEIIRYGHFVEAAYRSFDFNPSSHSFATCKYPKRKLLDQARFLGSGYRVTKNLIATSGIQTPKWIQQGSNWMGTVSSWAGYVAVCQDKEEIARLGRRDVVIAFRGTATFLEWLENLRANLTPLPDLEPGPMVESGFLSLYTSTSKNRPSLQTLVRQETTRILEEYDNEPLSFTIVGHSLGAALATLAAYDIKKTFQNSPLVTVISFAGPRVGNWSFRCCLEDQGSKVLRIVNPNDPVTKVPGFLVENDLDRTCMAASLGGWVRRLVDNMQWLYADVGCELRLSSRETPQYLVDGFKVAACHELRTYLHLVNGLASSNCPLRATSQEDDVRSMIGV